MTHRDFRVGDRVVVIGDSQSVISENVGDTGVIIRVDETISWATVMFDEGSGNNGWGFHGNLYPEAVSLGILEAEEYYAYRGKNLPMSILEHLNKTKAIQWID